MPKLNLRTAQRIKAGAGEALAIKGLGFEWFRKARVLVSGGVISNFTRGGVQYSQWLTRVSATMLSDGPIISASYALGAGGASSANGWNRGGGGGGDVQPFRDVIIPSGTLNIVIGAGGVMGAVTGSPSTLSGSISLNLLGGGQGAAGSIAAGTGANGGGGNNNQPPGIGTKHTGGAPENTRSGGGAGAGGDGGAGGVVEGKGGDGGPGVILDFMEPPIGAGGGGGGTSDRAGAGFQGIATHGGTDGVNSGLSQNADWSGGAGGVRVFGTGNTPGKGGDGFFVIVAPSKHVEFVQA